MKVAAVKAVVSVTLLIIAVVVIAQVTAVFVRSNASSDEISSFNSNNSIRLERLID